MNWLTLLAMEYVFFMLLSLVLSRGKLVTPGVLFFGSFSVMLLSSIIFNSYLKICLKEETFWIMFIAGLVFLLVEQAYRCFSLSTLQYIYKDKGECIINIREPIILQNTVANALVFLVTLFFLIVLYSLFSRYGSSGNLNQIMREYRAARINTHGKAALQFFIVNQVMKLCTAIAYVCSYILIYNKTQCGIPFLKQKKLMFVILLFIPTMIFASSGRQSTVEIILFFILSYILLLPIGGKKLKLLPLFLWGSLLLVAFVLIFTMSATWVGRADIYRNPIYYIIDYLCGGMINLNREVGEVFNYEYWGQSSFANIYAFLNKFEIVPDDAVLTYHSFGWAGDYAASTTVTIFGRWYEDFGGIGVCVMTGIVALVFSYIFYSRIDKRKAPNIFHIIYVKLSMALVWASYDDRIYAIISVAEIVTIVLISFFYWLLIGRGKRYKFVFGKSASHRRTLYIAGR